MNLLVEKFFIDLIFFVDNSLTLLHYIVKTYLKMCNDPVSASLPVPEPSDIEHATPVQFDDVKQQLQNLHKGLQGWCVCLRIFIFEIVGV